jgi:hypothetical protein
MFLTDDIVAYLQANIATDVLSPFTLSVDNIADTPDDLLAISDYDSISSGSHFINVCIHDVQIAVRSMRNETAHSLAQLLYEFIEQVNVSDEEKSDIVFLPSGRWANISTKQAPFKITRDTKQRYVWGFNIAVQTKTA